MPAIAPLTGVVLHQAAPRFTPQLVFKPLLEAGLTRVIEAHRAQYLRGRRAIGIVAAALLLELQEAQAQVSGSAGFGQGDHALDPLEAAALDASAQRMFVDCDSVGQRSRYLPRIGHLIGENANRVHPHAQGQFSPVAINEVPPARRDLHTVRVLACGLLGELLVLQHLQVDQLGQH